MAKTRTCSCCGQTGHDIRTCTTKKMEQWYANTKKKSIPKTLRMDVWKEYCTIQSVKCPVCEKKEISPFDFEVGHVVSERDGGSLDIYNLRPICSLCNRSMGTKNLFEFKKQFYSNNDSNNDSWWSYVACW